MPSDTDKELEKHAEKSDTTDHITAESSSETADADSKRPDPVRRVTKIVLFIVVVLFILYIATDRLAPWTDQARVQAYIVSITPQVSGVVREINVGQDDVVQPGDTLLKIDRTDYEIAVQLAESELEMAGQGVGANTASVATAQSRLVEARANVAHKAAQSERFISLEKKGLVSRAQADKARADLRQAKARVESAQSELEKAKQNLGVGGEDNPKIRAAIAKLKRAQIDLERTAIIAPARGGITNLKINQGHYASAGQPVMTFIAVDDIWIQANLKENNIANIKVGDKVDIALDVAPGRVFKGSVLSLGFAVETESGGSVGGLQTVKGKTGWLRDSQRFPVNIQFEDASASGLRRLGGQADVQFYGSSSLLNAIGWVWIRVLSWLSYVY